MLLDVLTSIHPSMDLTSEEHLAVFFNDPRESSTPSPSDCTLVLTLTFQPFRLPLLFARHLVKLRQIPLPSSTNPTSSGNPKSLTILKWSYPRSENRRKIKGFCILARHPLRNEIRFMAHTSAKEKTKMWPKIVWGVSTHEHGQYMQHMQKSTSLLRSHMFASICR